MTASVRSRVPACVAPEIRNAGPRYFSADCDRHRLRHGFFGRQQIALVEHQPARLGEQVFTELAELADDGDRVAHRISGRIGGRDVHEVQQHARALQMLEEADAETGAVGRAFDEAGNVGHHEAALVAARR